MEYVTSKNIGVGRVAREEKPVMDGASWRRFNEVVAELRKAEVEGALWVEEMFEGTGKVQKDVLSLIMLLCAKGVL